MNNEEAIKVLEMIECHGSLPTKAKAKAIESLKSNADLMNQLEELVEQLNEEIRTGSNMVTVAYKNGKRDAYAAVLCAMREGDEE